MATGRPAVSEYPPFYAGYVERVTEEDVLDVLGGQGGEIVALARSIPADKERFRYADGKWSVREVMGHLIDVERVFGYRAFSLSRGEQAALPGFEENDYVRVAGAGGVPVEALAEEFVAVRDSNLAFLRRLGEDGWTRAGIANGHVVSVRALAWIMAGHPRHHLAGLRERYGVPA